MKALTSIIASILLLSPILAHERTLSEDKIGCAYPVDSPSHKM